VWRRLSLLKGTVSRDFLLLVFFHESVFPQPQSIPLRPFQIFRKFAEIFASQVAPPISTTSVANLSPVSKTPEANFSKSFPCVADTGGKFATGVSDTGGKQCNHAVIKLLTTENELENFFYLYAYSTTQRCSKEIKKISDGRFFPFVTGNNVTGSAP
jgi:hypothetical protein